MNRHIQVGMSDKGPHCERPHTVAYTGSNLPGSGKSWRAAVSAILTPVLRTTVAAGLTPVLRTTVTATHIFDVVFLHALIVHDI